MGLVNVLLSRYSKNNFLPIHSSEQISKYALSWMVFPVFASASTGLNYQIVWIPHFITFERPFKCNRRTGNIHPHEFGFVLGLALGHHPLYVRPVSPCLLKLQIVFCLLALSTSWALSIHKPNLFRVTWVRCSSWCSISQISLLKGSLSVRSGVSS